MQEGCAWGGSEEHRLVHTSPQISSTTGRFMDGESFLWKRVPTVLGYARGCLKELMTSQLTQPVLVPPRRAVIAELWFPDKTEGDFVKSLF